jgi:hypothetical protein
MRGLRKLALGYFRNQRDFLTFAALEPMAGGEFQKMLQV